MYSVDFKAERRTSKKHGRVVGENPEQLFPGIQDDIQRSHMWCVFVSTLYLYSIYIVYDTTSCTCVSLVYVMEYKHAHKC